MNFKSKCIIITVCIALLMLSTFACSKASTETSSLDKAETESVDPTNVSDPVYLKNILETYMSAINEHDYETMYSLINISGGISKEDFITRNKNIYEGIRAQNLMIVIDDSQEDNVLNYETTMDTQAGQIHFTNKAQFNVYDGVYKLEWTSNIIFPNLNDDDKVRVSTITGERGNILDRNGELIVGKDNVYSVGFVPGKIIAESREEDIEKVAEILNMTIESINNKLSENWVKDDLFVPLKNISYTDTIKKEALLQIKGIALNTAQDRVYKLGEKAAHLTGYIQPINQDELNNLAGQGYDANSKIGKIGMESLLEERIRGIDGCKIYIIDKDNQEKETLAELPARNGENVMLTIDTKLQEKLYDQMKGDKGVAVVMEPNTGEILALVSTPSYDPNGFILGLTEEKWAEYNDEETRPMYNRFKATFVPGSAFKPITAALGISSNSFTAQEDFGPSGLTWKKEDWIGYSVTTLKQYSGAANVKNALINSDNIYFAKAALKIGKDNFTEGLKSIGFGEDVPFEFGMSNSTFGTDLVFDDDIDIANSGFGQGKVLINPIHMASIISAFVNEGDMMAPYLEKDNGPTVWKQSVFTDDAVQSVVDGMIQVIEDPNGTGHSFKINGLTIAGKTGTAEIKNSKQDTEGTEQGWFVAFPADKSQEKQYLVVAVIEDVKGRGGSHYVIPIVRSIFAD